MLPLDPMWIVGFVDGEGCFSVSLHRNDGAPWGWQLHPTFQVYRHHRHRVVLEALIDSFGCGKVRSKGPNSNVLTYAVDSMATIEQRVLPFFERYTLRVKACDFAAFATIVRSLRRREHREQAGFERLVRMAYGMNQAGRQRARPIEYILGGSSETVRQAPSPDGR